MNRHPCRRHAIVGDTCVLCGAAAHVYCQQDYHRCWDGGWNYPNWWREVGR